MMTFLIPRSCQIALAALLLPIACVAASGEIQNPELRDADQNGLPDGWQPFPGGEGLQALPDGGVRINDSSESKGLGLGQFVPVTPGATYTVTAELEGEGGLFTYMNFVSEVPGQMKKLGAVTVQKKREWCRGGGKGTAKATEFSQNAPLTASHLWVWLYNPSAGTTDVIVRKVSLTENLPGEGSSNSAAANKVTVTEKVAFDAQGALGGDWEAFPPAQPPATQLEVKENGIRLVDHSKSDGLGITRWFDVEGGATYQAHARIEGNRGLFLYVVFCSDKPARKSGYDDYRIAQKRTWLHPGEKGTLTALAPEQAKWARVWVYSPSSNTCDARLLDVSVQKLEMQDSRDGLFGLMDFETGDFSQASTREGQRRAIVSSSEGPVREGKYAYHAMLEKSQVRTELTGPRSPAYGIARYGWSVYVPENFDAETQFTIVTQWHDYGSGREYPKDGGAPTHLYISNGNWGFKLRHQGEGHSTASEIFKLGPVNPDRGKWTDWVFEVNWQAPGDGGWMKLYKDGELVASHEGATWYEGKDLGPYFKFGLYKGSGNWRGEEKGAHLYFDSFRMATGENSTYELVAPATRGE